MAGDSLGLQSPAAYSGTESSTACRTAMRDAGFQETAPHTAPCNYSRHNEVPGLATSNSTWVTNGRKLFRDFSTVQSILHLRRMNILTLRSGEQDTT